MTRVIGCVRRIQRGVRSFIRKNVIQLLTFRDIVWRKLYAYRAGLENSKFNVMISIMRKKYLPYINDLKELVKLNKFKSQFQKDREEYKAKRRAVQVIEEFWLSVLNERYENKMRSETRSSTQKCADLHTKFLNLKKQAVKIRTNLKKINE
jgi:hypothetical protein